MATVRDHPRGFISSLGKSDVSIEQANRIREWVKALRSGKYKQARGALRNDNAYCCLGVACDLSGVADWKDLEESGWVYDGESGFPSHAVLSIFGLTPAEASSLAELNDSGGIFTEVADRIEASILPLADAASLS